MRLTPKQVQDRLPAGLHLHYERKKGGYIPWLAWVEDRKHKDKAWHGGMTLTEALENVLKNPKVCRKQ